MSSPRGRAAPGRAERRDGRRRSASIPWRRGRPEGSRERASGGWRGEAWGLRVAAGGRGLDGPLELPGHGRFPAALFRLQCPLSLSCRLLPVPTRRVPVPAAVAVAGSDWATGRRGPARFESAAGVHGHEITRSRGWREDGRWWINRVMSVFGRHIITRMKFVLRFSNWSKWSK